MNARITRFDEYLQTHRLRLFLIFWAIVAALYLPAWKGGFAQDFHSWLEMYRDNDLRGILNRNGASIHSLYQVTQLQLFVWTWLFGIHPVPWFLLFTGLQALNGTLLFLFCARLFRDFSLPGSSWIALLGALLFLLSPNMSEVVVWKASYHYLTGLQIILWILLLGQRYLHTGKIKYALLAGLLFFISLFTLEIFFTTPWLLLCLFTCYYWHGGTDKARFGKALRCFFLPMILLFGGYLLLYHSIYGLWIAHGAYDTSGPVTISILAGRVIQYEFHTLLFGRFFPYGIRQWVYHSLAENPVVYAGFLALLIGFALYAIIRFRRLGPRFQLAAFLVAASFITLAIILHFGIDDILLVSNDRYLYLTSAFQCMLLAVLAGSLASHRKALMAVSAGLLSVYFLLSVDIVMKWRHATKVFYGIQHNFRWQDAPVVLLLNIPTNYQGIGLINANKEDAFNPHLRIFTRDTARGKLYDVAGYTMSHAWDGAHVTVLDSTRLKVTLNQWGTWWLFGTRGAVDYENEVYAVKFTDPGHEYELTLKQSIPGMVILFEQGEQWRVVDLNKAGRSNGRLSLLPIPAG